MNRPIKFRGKRVDNGEFVFGDIAHTEVGILMDGGFEVVPDSVAQLVGYDANGREVYEDDVLIDHKTDKEYEARLCGIAHNPFRITDEFFKLNLKEATK